MRFGFCAIETALSFYTTGVECWGAWGGEGMEGGYENVCVCIYAEKLKVTPIVGVCVVYVEFASFSHESIVAFKTTEIVCG